MSEDSLLVRFDETSGVATLTFNRPAVFNALDVDMARAFSEAIADLRARRDVRCVVITGNGKAFMAGGDVAAFARDVDRAPRLLASILGHMHSAILDLRQLDAPVIAAVNGTAAGAGLSLVLGADLAISARSARFVFAYDRLGGVPDCGGSWFMTRRMGRANAMRFALGGAPLDAHRALEMNVVDEVIADDAMMERVESVAMRLAQGPTRAFGLTRRLLDADLPLAEQLEMERTSFMEAAATEDFRRATTAFVEKKEPRFDGR